MICQSCGVRYKKDPIFNQCPACGRPNVVKWSFEFTENEFGELRIDCRGNFKMEDVIRSIPESIKGSVNIYLPAGRI